MSLFPRASVHFTVPSIAFRKIQTSLRMSVTFKFGSEETVTSQYIIPVIDLLSDDEMKVDLEAEKSGKKGKTIAQGDSASVEASNRKRMKFYIPPTAKFHDAKQGTSNASGILRCIKKAKLKNKVVVDHDATPVVVLDSTDESSG